MNKIVVYHSYTGHTKMIANMIKEKLNCDILELKPKIAFSSDYQSVVDEYQNNEKEKSTVEIEDINIDFDNYDEKKVKENVGKHYENSSLLIGKLEDGDIIKMRYN